MGSITEEALSFKVDLNEVHCEIKITMVGNIINHHLLVRYESLLRELYIEPKDEEIINTFLSIRNEHENVNHEIEAVQAEPLKKTGQKKTEVKSKDIRDMFQNSHQNPRKILIMIREEKRKTSL